MGSTFVSFLLPLIVGYTYIRGNPKERFFSQTETGYQYIIRCVAYGTFFILFSALVLHFSSQFDDTKFVSAFLKNLSNIIQKYTAFKIAESYLLSLLFSVVIYLYFKKEETVEKRINIVRELLQEKGSEIESMIFENVVSESYEPILISLKSRKVYVGYVLGFPMGGRSFPDNISIEFLPEKSGHRNTEDLKLKIDHEYVKFWSKENPIKVTINVEDIETVSPWNEKLYQELSKKKTTRKTVKKKPKK